MSYDSPQGKVEGCACEAQHGPYAFLWLSGDLGNKINLGERKKEKRIGKDKPHK